VLITNIIKILSATVYAFSRGALMLIMKATANECAQMLLDAQQGLWNKPKVTLFPTHSFQNHAL